MSAGIVKTPSSGREAKAPKSAERKANSNSNNSGTNTGSGGKKFVQTRLPFKLLTPVAKAGAAAATSTSTPSSSSSGAAGTAGAGAVLELDRDEVEREPRKRKLSYSCDKDSDAEQLRRSNSKENLELGVATKGTSKKPKTIDVIELVDDDDEDDNNEELEDELEAETVAKKPRKKIEDPVQIKLPLNKKRAKRRKSLKKSESVEQVPVPVTVERSDSSDDIEAIAEELNPQKRPKVLEDKCPTPVPAKKETSKKPSEIKTKKDVVDSDEALVESECEVSSDVGMDVDTDTPKETSPEKEKAEQEAETEPEAEKSLNVSGKTPNPPTAKKLKLMEQRRKAREEKERKLQEERLLKQQEKEQREQQKKAEREQKEELRRKEREDKEQQKRQEREEKERKRQAEVDKKDEEKRKRNEAKEEIQRKKDEERRRKDQEKQDAELKKQRAAASFSRFFVPKQPRASTGGSLDQDQNSCDSSPSTGNSQSLAFRPFQIKDDMIMAPIVRTTIPDVGRQQLDGLFHEDEDEDMNESIGRVKRPTRNQLYLGELSLGRHKPLSSKRDIKLQRRSKDDEDDDDVQVIDDLANAGTPILEERPKQLPWLRAKYLHFADNRRPPYYGTWRKRSQRISARRPLEQDKAHFDYEVDSDCEWEEEEPGESLSASEDEKERESEEESEEEYNEWFVPHGHLSDEELQNDGELEDGNTREAQKAKLQVLQQEFAQEMKKQTKKIKPRLLGPVWLDENGNKSQLCPAVFTQTIEMYGCWQLQPLVLEPPPELVEEEPQEETKVKSTVLQLDETLLQQLVRLIHGNSNSKAFLISEYLEYLKTQLMEAQVLPPKTLLREKFDELASWKPVVVEHPASEARKAKKPKKRLCWLVSDEMLHKYQLDELTLQNQWSYTLTPKVSKADTSLRDASPPPPDATDAKPEMPKLSKPATPITTHSSPSVTVSGGKKRGTLISVARDQPLPASTKNALISQYLRKQNDDKKPSAQLPAAAPAATPNTISDVVLLSD